jgi:alkylation response protein AidB-like acyl-CoA dehydrogenase
VEFAFTEEQLMIRDSSIAFLQNVSTSESIRKAMATEQGYEEAVWSSLCQELYLQAITVPEDFGGLGLGVVELVAVMEQMGQYLLCSPFFSTVCLAATAVRLAANEQQQADFFAKLLEGETAALAFTSNTQFNSKGVEVAYKKSGDQFVLNGEYRYVVDGHTAKNLVLIAREEGSAKHDGLAFFIVPAETQGISRKWLPTVDQTRKMATISLDNLTLDAGNLMREDAVDAFHQTLDLATITLAAEQVGGAQKALDLTVEYTKERVQFNRPVASFQSVKHKAADMMTRVEAARSGVYYAACVADDALNNGPLASELKEAASIVKAAASEAYFQNAGDAIQLHGGVGFTWEYDVHLYFKRAKASEHFLGSPAYHRERLAKDLLGE